MLLFSLFFRPLSLDTNAKRGNYFSFSSVLAYVTSKEGFLMEVAYLEGRIKTSKKG